MRLRLPRRPVLAFAPVLLLSAAVSAQPGKVLHDRDPAVLARLSDDARAALGTPGLSAAIVSGDVVVWAQGFGQSRCDGRFS